MRQLWWELVTINNKTNRIDLFVIKCLYHLTEFFSYLGSYEMQSLIED